MWWRMIPKSEVLFWLALGHGVLCPWLYLLAGGEAAKVIGITAIVLGCAWVGARIAEEIS